LRGITALTGRIKAALVGQAMRNMNRPKIKFVKRANCWCVTHFKRELRGLRQRQEWFNSRDEAEKFAEELTISFNLV